MIQASAFKPLQKQGEMLKPIFENFFKIITKEHFQYCICLILVVKNNSDLNFMIPGILQCFLRFLALYRYRPITVPLKNLAFRSCLFPTVNNAHHRSHRTSPYRQFHSERNSLKIKHNHKLFIFGSHPSFNNKFYK